MQDFYVLRVSPPIPQLSDVLTVATKNFLAESEWAEKAFEATCGVFLPDKKELH